MTLQDTELSTPWSAKLFCFSFLSCFELQVILSQIQSVA